MKKFITMLAMLSCMAFAEDAVWTTDFEAAKVRAAKEGKDLFLMFSGSDWCPSCTSMEADLAKEEIKQEIVKRYVPVILDFPKNVALPANVLQQNERLAERFAIGLVPTAIIIDADGKAIAALVGWQDGFNFKEAFEFFDGIKKERDVALKQAMGHTGAERALAINNVLITLGSKSKVFADWSNYGYDAEIADIIKNDDPKGKVKIFWDYRLHVIESRIQLLIKNYPGALKPLEEFIALYPDDTEHRVMAMFAKAQIQKLAEDTAGCIATLKLIVEVSPEGETGKIAKQALDYLEKQAQEGK